MPINNCYLIVIEGPDKVGKETQSKLLVESLQTRFYKTFEGQITKKRVPISVVREEIPYRDGITHTKIYDMLKSGEAVDHPDAFQTLQVANRMIWQKTVLTNMSMRKDVIILDRWNISSWVYGRASGCSEKMLDCLLRDIVKPDIVFVFDGDPFITPEREDDSYERNKVFMAKVRRQYQRWASKNPGVAVKVEANRPKDVVQEKLVRHCLEKLKFS